MHIEDLKRWHWAILGVVVGLALSYVWSNLAFDSNLPTLGAREFEAGLVTEKDVDGSLRNVVVLPLNEGKHPVVVDVVRDKGVPGKRDVQRMALVTDVPYRAGLWRG